MTKPHRRRAPAASADAAVDPRAQPGSYLMSEGGAFIRTDNATGEPEASVVGLPAASAQALLDAFKAMGVEPPEHLVAAAGQPAAAPADDDETGDQQQSGPGDPPVPPPETDSETEA